MAVLVIILSLAAALWVGYLLYQMHAIDRQAVALNDAFERWIVDEYGAVDRSPYEKMPDGFWVPLYRERNGYTFDGLEVVGTPDGEATNDY